MAITHVIDQTKAVDGTPAASPNTASPERLKALAAQFESILVGQMMQQMRASMFTDDDGKEDSGNAPLADALFAELSLALAKAGGLGLANSFVAPLSRQIQGGDASPLDPTMGIALPESSPALAGRVSSAYGWRRYPIDDVVKFHRGMDIAMPVGQEIPAPQAGTVAFAGDQPGYGLTVVIDHGGQLQTRFAHLSAIDVRAGDQVQAGQVIARSGQSGRVTGPHLHIEVSEAGKTVNPAEKLGTYSAVRHQ